MNIDKIIKRVNINIVPIKISSNTIEPISHNQDGILENIVIVSIKSNKGNFKVIDKEPFISILSRLNELGRDKWRKLHLNYLILRE